MVKAVVFDMDGLMFDTERVFVQAWDYAGEKIGIGKAGHMVLKTLGLNIHATREIWQREYGDRYSEEDLRKYTKEFVQEYYRNHKTPVKKGLYNLLNYLKNAGYPLGIATSSSRLEVEKHLANAGITDRFQAIATGDVIKNSKPAPDLYIKACELLNVAPECCIALEDSRNGILSANAAGCKTIMVPDLWQPDEQVEKLLYARCDNLDDVITVFATLNS